MKSRTIFRATILIVAGFLVCGVATAQDQSLDDVFAAADCGVLENAYGPFDYTNPSHFAERLPIVEAYHFNSDVEALKRGMTGELPGGDLTYTLHAFPNHHRALYSMGRYALQYPNERVPPGASYSAECYFQRAIRFRKDDAVVRLVYGIFLSMVKRNDDAIKQLKIGQQLDGNNPEIHYNLGLIYEKNGNDDLALKHAKRAYELGFPMQGLRNILKRKGVWDNA